MDPMLSHLERRKHPRYAAQWPVSFAGETVAGEGTVIDVSEGGCSILSSKIVAPGALLDLHLLLHSRSSLHSIRVVSAEVRWSSGRLLGVHFRRLEPEAHARLVAALRTLSDRAMARSRRRPASEEAAAATDSALPRLPESTRRLS